MGTNNFEVGDTVNCIWNHEHAGKDMRDDAIMPHIVRGCPTKILGFFKDHSAYLDIEGYRHVNINLNVLVKAED